MRRMMAQQGFSGQVGVMMILGASLIISASCVNSGVSERTASSEPSSPAVETMAPQGPVGDGPRVTVSGRVAGAADLSRAGAVAWGTAPAGIVDTRQLPNMTDEPVVVGEARAVRNMLPPHEKPAQSKTVAGDPNDLAAMPTMAEPRTTTERMFPTISATGWVPPDPTLAVGPGHVVVTVNQDIAWYTRAGVQQFRTNLGSPGNPGFFEPLGARNFVFDPKVIYDHYAQRFVVVVLETYDGTEAWVDIAVSDDSDPNGVWYKYRTNAVLNIGTNDVWWDFPGIGYDQNAYYVTGNLFSLQQGGSYGGVGFRIFDKAPLLTGSAATFATLREPGGYTIMPALHYGANTSAYFANVFNSTTVRVYAINNPLTAPTLVSTSVATPSHTGAVGAPTLNGSAVSNAPFTMPYWRNGKLSLIHNASTGGRNIARWHELRTNNWPASGSVTRFQSGDVDAGINLHTVFPAIGMNAAGDIGVVIGSTGVEQRVGVAIAGRRAADPLGRMGVPILVKAGERDGGGRWGDYQAVTVDPVDDATFWVVGEYLAAGGGWQNWVTSFRVSDQSLCHAVADNIGNIQAAGSSMVDVLANDWHSTGLPMTIQAFDAVSVRGGTIVRSVGTGPGGRDRLIYTPPASLPNATDSFQYTIADAGGQTSTAAVVARLYNPATFRVPENPVFTRPGVAVRYYDLAAPQTLPDFASLTPFANGVVGAINFPSTNGAFATSTRADNVGAVYEGYVEITASDLYTFSTESDDGSRIYLGNTMIVDNNGVHGMEERTSAAIGLRPGKHRLRVEFFEGGGGAGLIVRYTSSTLARQAIPASRWFIERCAADVDNGGGGGVADGGVGIEDLLYYVSRYDAGVIGADVDDGTSTGTPDGGVGIEDLLYYLARYDSGC